MTEDNTRPGRVRAGIAALALLGTTMVVLLFVFEGVVRVFDLQGDIFLGANAYVGWSHDPGRSGTYISAQAKAPVSYNSLGLPGPEISKEKPAGTKRLLLLGDSFTESEQVPYEESWGARIGQALGSGWQVVNTGVSGYGTGNELLFLREYGWDFSPDVVFLLFFTGNDVSDNDAGLRAATGTWIPGPSFSRGEHGLEVGGVPMFVPPEEGLLKIKRAISRRSRLYQWVRLRVADLRALGQTSNAASSDGKETVPLAWHVYHTPVNGDWERAWDTTDAIFTALRDECRERGVPLYVGLLPTGWRIDPDQRAEIEERLPELFHDPSWQLDLPDQRMMTILDSLAVPYVDLAPLLEARVREGGGPLYGDHLTEEGHEVVARGILDFLAPAVTSRR
ncbi:MAG: GDSL-type esterase/lipase family protein [Candidatus Eisenbacteria bacterium]